MNRKHWLLVAAALMIAALLCSCASLISADASEEDVSSPTWKARFSEEYEALFGLFNSYQGSVCMGISGTQTDRSTAIGIATENCLKYLSFYRGLAVQVDFGVVVEEGKKDKITDYMIAAGTSDKNVMDAAKDMEIVDVVWLGGKIGAVVFARLPEMKGINYSGYIPGTVPSIPGYNVVLATSEKAYSKFDEAIEAATFQAAKALVEAHNKTINVSNTITATTETTYKNDSYSITGNRLEGFAVLAYYYNQEENKVYALAAAEQ